MKIRRLLFFLILSFAVVFNIQPAKAQCHPSPDLSTMNRNFLYFLNQQISKKNNKIAILPLFDNTTGIKDSALYYGLPFYIYDIFSPATQSMIHPYLTLEALKQLGISGDQLAKKSSAKKLAQKLNAKFVIFGSFQKTFTGTIRVLVNVYNAKTESVLSPAQNFESSFDDSFFDLLQNHVAKAFSRTKSAPKLRAFKTETPSMESFIHLSKGLELASKYDSTSLQLAVLWFQKGLKESFHKYDNAALHLARAYFMLGLIQKLNKMDFSQNWQSALDTISYIKHKPSKLPVTYLITYRFLQARPFVLKAVTSYMAKNPSLTHKYSLQGLKLVPEDGIMQNLYLASLKTNQNKEVIINNPICF